MNTCTLISAYIYIVFIITSVHKVSANEYSLIENFLNNQFPGFSNYMTPLAQFEDYNEVCRKIEGGTECSFEMNGPCADSDHSVCCETCHKFSYFSNGASGPPYIVSIPGQSVQIYFRGQCGDRGDCNGYRRKCYEHYTDHTFLVSSIPVDTVIDLVWAAWTDCLYFRSLPIPDYCKCVQQ